MPFFLALFRAILIGANMFLINFVPNSALENKMFFAARTVFFLMLIIDYTQIAYYNQRLEKAIGVIGALIACFFACVEGAGFFELIVLKQTDIGYTLIGNQDNFITSMLPDIKAQVYVFANLIIMVILLGFEVVNRGVKSLNVDSNPPKEGSISTQG